MLPQFPCFLKQRIFNGATSLVSVWKSSQKSSTQNSAADGSAVDEGPAVVPSALLRQPPSSGRGRLGFHTRWANVQSEPMCFERHIRDLKCYFSITSFFSSRLASFVPASLCRPTNGIPKSLHGISSCEYLQLNFTKELPENLQLNNCISIKIKFCKIVKWMF